MFRKLLMTATFLISGILCSGVNVNNGNFYIAYTDFIFPNDGISPEITRTYNSRSSFVQGALGVGWSSEYESFLSFKNKVPTLHEAGGGNNILFSQEGPGRWINKEYGIQKIEAISMKQNGSDVEKASFYKKLGAPLKKDVAFRLTRANGRKMIFNDYGQLLRMSDANKNFLDFHYKNKTLVKIQDNFSNQVHLKWKNFGGFKRIVLVESGDKKSRYRYSQAGDLLSSKGMDGSTFEYDYDDEHNLIKISYANGAFKKIGYNKVKDWVTSFRDIDGVNSQYGYYSDSVDPENKFGTALTRTHPGESFKEEARFWYEFRKRPDNTKYNYRSVTLFQDLVTETVFTACCGTPLSIAQWNLDKKAQLDQKSSAWMKTSGKKFVTKFSYDSEGMLEEKVFPNGKKLSISYHPESKKIKEIVNGSQRVAYEYDDSLNLASAFDYSQGNRLDFVYDYSGKVTAVLQKDLKSQAEVSKLYFKYDSDGRPLEVKEKMKLGSAQTLKFKYGSQGEVLEILNAKGRAVASEPELSSTKRVYATFQQIIDVVQPSGIGLDAERAL